jgi:hypothetical protein
MDARTDTGSTPRESNAGWRAMYEYSAANPHDIASMTPE